MRNGNIKSLYEVNDTVRIHDINSPFYNMEGSIARIGLAFPFVLLHVIFPSYGVSPMTVYEKQAELVEKGIAPPAPINEPVRIEPGIDSEVVTNTPDPISDISPVIPVMNPNPAPKKRGRPKGSKNKK